MYDNSALDPVLQINLDDIVRYKERNKSDSDILKLIVKVPNKPTKEKGELNWVNVEGPPSPNPVYTDKDLEVTPGE